MATRSVRGTIRHRLLAGPRQAYHTALDSLDTPPHVADDPIDAPWIAAVHYDGGDRSDHFTGLGVVIAPDWVLTCAHLFCPALDQPHTGEPPTAEKTFHVRIGDPRLFTGKRHTIAERIENGYLPAIGTPDARKNRAKPSADLALLRLTEPTDVPPARLLAGPISEGTALTCLGWPDGHHGPGLLTQVNTTTITRKAALGGLIKSDEFCAANVPAPASMSNGYSGGAARLVPGTAEDAPPPVVGLLSRGADIGDDTISWPAIIVDLTSHREFIEATTGVTFLTAERTADL
ncbi:trypsin-like serine protease [Amycolatopsis sp. cg9]|uniref:trypsin-like serine protease n=1 Tax=Amycolatopsis sp. cg9 TaxID=3238801 RepID=UPI003523C201